MNFINEGLLLPTIYDKIPNNITKGDILLSLPILRPINLPKLFPIYINIYLTYLVATLLIDLAFEGTNFL